MSYNKIVYSRIHAIDLLVFINTRKFAQERSNFSTIDEYHAWFFTIILKSLKSQIDNFE